MTKFWKNIKENYSEAYRLYQDWKKPLLDGEVNICKLYKFFDKNNIIISILYGVHRFFVKIQNKDHILLYPKEIISGYKTRLGAEKSAFTHGFKILNTQINEKIT